MSNFNFNGFGIVTLVAGKGTPNGSNYSLTLEYPSTKFDGSYTRTSVCGWGFGGGYDRARDCYSGAEEEVRGLYRENFDRGVEWANLMFVLSQNGFVESHKRGTFVRRA